MAGLDPAQQALALRDGEVEVDPRVQVEVAQDPRQRGQRRVVRDAGTGAGRATQSR